MGKQMNQVAILVKLKQSALYRNRLRALVWNSVVPLLRMAIKARLFYRHLRNEDPFRRLARKDRTLLAESRHKNDRLYANEKNPLISVTIATYNRAGLLAEKVLPAVLCQTYENFEVIIVGDHCTDDTPDRLAKIKDPRVQFFNLRERPTYPSDKKDRWRIAGVEAIRRARDMSRGSWIAHVDDDDVFTPDHLEKLLGRAQEGNYEFVSGRSRIESRTGKWAEKGSMLFRRGPLYSGAVGPVMHSTILYRSYLRFFAHDVRNCLDFELNGDAFVMRRMFNVGVRAGFVNEVLTIQPLRPGQSGRQASHPVE